jgi:hypothetical protein
MNEVTASIDGEPSMAADTAGRVAALRLLTDFVGGVGYS